MTFELFCPERGCGYRKELKKRDKDYGLGIRYHMGGGGGGGGQASKVKTSNTVVTMAAQTQPTTLAPATLRGSVENLHAYHPHTYPASYTSDASKLQTD